MIRTSGDFEPTRLASAHNCASPLAPAAVGGYSCPMRRAAFVLLAAAACATPAGPAVPAAPANDLDGGRPGDPTGAIAGTVRDVATGDVIAFAAIEATSTDGRRAVDTSGAAGEFRLRVPPGRYRLRATFGDLHAALPEVVVLQNRVTRIHIDLDSRAPLAGPGGPSAVAATATGEIAGRVTDGVGAHAVPFAGAVVAAMAPGLADAPMAISDQRGRYRLRGLRPGRYDLTVYYQLVDRGAIELRRSDIEVVAGRATHVDLELDLQRQ